MKVAGVYKRREPEKTDFYKIVFNYHEEYEKVYPKRFEKEYGYLRKRVIEVVHKFLDCGILEHGMARVYCRECGGDFFVAIEFLHRVCLHIPDPYESLIRYYGFYANAARGKRKKLGIENSNKDNIEIKILDDTPSPKTCRKSWRQLIYKIYEIDPLKCPKCGSEMKIIAFIQDREEIINILKHIKIWPIEYPQPPPENSFLYTGLLSKLAASKHLN